MPLERRNDLTGYRRAELLVPDSVSLDSVFRIVCRTPAERETLLALLDKEQRNAWRDRIYISGASLRDLYQADWVYVESVQWTDSGLIIKFNPRAVTLPISIQITDRESGDVLVKKSDTITFTYRSNQIQIALPSIARRVRARIDLDGCLAYQSTLNRLDLLKKS